MAKKTGTSHRTKKPASTRAARKKPARAKQTRSRTGSGSRTKTTPRRGNRSPKVNTNTAPGNGGKAATGSAVRIRMYRVGFGDFFLLSVRDAQGAYVHVLIDCGVHAANLNSIGSAITQLAADTQKHLALVIMTHRHADHISGFASGKSTFAEFTVDRVWMPWFEDPKNDKAVRFQSNLTAVAARLGQQLALRAAEGDRKFQNMMTNITSVSAAAGGSNATALDVLHGGFKNKAPVDYYKAGDKPTLPAALVAAGVSAKVLGPPIDPDLIAQMDNKNHQYLSASASDSDSGSIHPFSRAFSATAGDYPAEQAFALFKPAELERAIGDAQPDMLAARAQRADNTINNQSLVVLFEVVGKKLLFAGDAQWGNWANFLFGGKLSASGTPTLTAESKAILGGLDFYKVGHHGSTNATPIDALQAMRSGFVAMCSTEPGAYGKESNNSEVPRKPLIAALKKQTKNQLAQSTGVAVPEHDAEEPLPSMFKSLVPGAIDYTF